MNRKIRTLAKWHTRRFAAAGSRATENPLQVEKIKGGYVPVGKPPTFVLKPGVDTAADYKNEAALDKLSVGRALGVFGVDSKKDRAELMKAFGKAFSAFAACKSGKSEEEAARASLRNARGLLAKKIGEDKVASFFLKAREFQKEQVSYLRKAEEKIASRN